jgi:hypothetical protein
MKMQRQTVAEKIRELDAARSNPNRKKTNDELEREKESEFNTYHLLAASDTCPNNSILSLRQQVLNKQQLLELRRKFWDDERSSMVDPQRPANLKDSEAEVKSLLALLAKSENHPGWKKTPRESDKTPLTLDEFIQVVTGWLKTTSAMIVFLALAFSASAQQTNLFTNQVPNQPIYSTNGQAGGSYGVFIPLQLEAVSIAATNYYANGTNYQGQGTTNIYGATNYVYGVTNPPYNGGYITPVGAPVSLNVSLALWAYASNNVAGTNWFTVQESVSGIDWQTVWAGSYSNGIGTNFISTATNFSVGGFSLFRLYSIGSATGSCEYTNCGFAVAEKSGL